VAAPGVIGSRNDALAWRTDEHACLYAIITEVDPATELAAALKAEAHRRVEAHSFSGHVVYASLTARKPA
jgi:hypothetical protein